jgi:hypothetical protein
MKKAKPGRFAKTFEKDKQLIRDQVQLAARNLAVTAYVEIVNRSPIWAGDYILSHRIGIGKESSVPPIDTRIGFKPEENSGLNYIPEASGEAKTAMLAAAAAQIGQIETAKAFENIHISNDNAHAMAVETTGTPRNPQGYHPYDLAGGTLEAQGTRIANVANKINPTISDPWIVETSDQSDKKDRQ